MENIYELENETFLLENLLQTGTEVEAGNAKVDFITPTFSALETESI